MLLLVDAGNTSIKWALVDRPPHGAPDLGNWTTSGAMARDAAAQLGQAWRDLPITRAIVSNVAGPAIKDQLQQMLTSRSVTMTWFAAVPFLAGVHNRYRHPTQLGCDRFAAAIGAHALLPDQAITIATCGTATTIDAITSDGVFLGGMILPGLGLMAQSLAHHTAQLPHIEPINAMIQPFADNTEQAIVSGCLTAQIGAIEHTFSAHAKQHGATCCVLSGGAAVFIAPHLSIPHRHVDNLVLVGLQRAALEFSLPGS